MLLQGVFYCDTVPTNTTSSVFAAIIVPKTAISPPSGNNFLHFKRKSQKIPYKFKVTKKITKIKKNFKTVWRG